MNEQPLEYEVSKVIGEMPFLWLAIDDAAGPESLRSYVEKNAVALLSNYKKQALDAPSSSWLGHNCNRERVRDAGLWNSDYVDKSYDPAFIDHLYRLVSEVGNPA